jgi:hypothetical protein
MMRLRVVSRRKFEDGNLHARSREGTVIWDGNDGQEEESSDDQMDSRAGWNRLRDHLRTKLRGTELDLGNTENTLVNF